MIPVVPFLCKKVRLRLEECGCHEGLTLFYDDPRHEGLGHPSNIGDSFAAGIGLYRVLGARIHNSIGGSQAVTNTGNKIITSNKN